MVQGFVTAYGMSYQPEGYKELIAYQLAFNESMRLYWLLPMLPTEEDSLLAEKLVEGSRRVCMLLAAAWEQRRYRDLFVTKLNDAKAQAAQLQTWIAFAVECGYVEAQEGQVHCDLYGDILVEIGYLIQTATVVVNLVR
jgi:four helix bundle protein